MLLCCFTTLCFRRYHWLNRQWVLIKTHWGSWQLQQVLCCYWVSLTMHRIHRTNLIWPQNMTCRVRKDCNWHIYRVQSIFFAANPKRGREVWIAKKRDGIQTIVERSTNKKSTEKERLEVMRQRKSISKRNKQADGEQKSNTHTQQGKRERIADRTKFHVHLP